MRPHGTAQVTCLLLTFTVRRDLLSLQFMALPLHLPHEVTYYVSLIFLDYVSQQHVDHILSIFSG